MNNTTLQFLPRFPECFLPFPTKYADVKNALLTAISASLIPFIISFNLLLIFGITKTKRNKFTSSQILFLTLFSSDLTFGLVQLPVQIYHLRNSHNPTCFQIHLRKFSMVFPICLSDTLLCVISLDRYIYVAHNNYYKAIVTKWSLTITIVCTILTSATWATFDVSFKARHEITKIAKFCFAMTVYMGTMLTISVILYAALLRIVKQTTKKSSILKGLDSSLTKTIAVLVAIMVVTYFPFMVSLSVYAYEVLNTADIPYIQKLADDLLWTVLPCQMNAVINSVIYLAKNGRMKRYYSKLFNCGHFKRNLRKVAPLNVPINGKTQHHFHSMSKSEALR